MADEIGIEKPCPGFATGECATCDCPWFTPDPEPRIAPRGALFVRGGVTPWEVAHPDDVKELARRQAIRDAARMFRQVTGTGGNRTAYVMAALRGEAQNIIDGGRHNDQINRSAFKLFKRYVENGELTKTQVAQVIWDAAYEHGYENAIIGTLASALNMSKDEVYRAVRQ